MATTFHTSCTGNPKQVFFSHRQLVLHTLAAGIRDLVDGRLAAA